MVNLERAETLSTKRRRFQCILCTNTTAGNARNPPRKTRHSTTPARALGLGISISDPPQRTVGYRSYRP